MAVPEIRDREFNELRRYIRDVCGLHIQDSKRYLVQQRLEPLLQESGCQDFSQFYALLENAPDRELREQIIAAITTNETSFFRDAHPFETFRNHILPSLCNRLGQDHAAGRPERIRIWSAACSTGQEPYSLAMDILQSLHPVNGRAPHGLQPHNFHILGTDICETVLVRAREGCYREAELARGLDGAMMERFFIREDDCRRAAPELRDMVEFQRLNLLEPYGLPESFDVIFCRNVLIYFDDPTKRSITALLARKLRSHGFLILGAAENLYGVGLGFRSEKIGRTLVYRKA